MTFPLTFAATILTAVAVAGCMPDQPPAADPQALDAEVRVAASGSTDTAPRRLLMPGPATKALGWYLAGWQARKAGNFALASRFLDQALAADPGDPYLRYQLFLVALSAGKVDRAMELAAAIADDGRVTGIVHLAVVLDLIRQGDLASAEARLAGSSDDDIGALLRNTLLAWVKAGSGQTDAALTTLATIGEKSQPQVFHDFHAGLISEQAGRNEQALAYYESAGKSVEDLSLRMAQRIGAFLERNGRADKAAELYSRHLKDRPESTLIAKALERLEDGGKPPPPIAGAAEGAAEALLDVASAISQPRSARMALIYGRLAAWLDPDLYLADMLVGSILESLERYEDAIAVYRQVPADPPLNWTAELRIARNLEQLERDPEAIELFNRLVHGPVRVEALTGLGDLLRRNKEFDSAAEAYGRALDGIDSIEAGHWRLLFKRGMAFERAKKWKLAERDLEHALRLRPDQPYVLNYLAYSWADQGINLERAHGMLERAVSQRPDDGYIVDSLGWIFYRMKDFETAVRHLERAVELRSQDPTINDHLGDAYWRVGRFQEARFQWKRALSLDPEPEDVQTIEDKIRDGLNAAPDPEKDS